VTGGLGYRLVGAKFIHSISFRSLRIAMNEKKNNAMFEGLLVVCISLTLTLQLEILLLHERFG
jgi:hypothetical protein